MKDKLLILFACWALSGNMQLHAQDLPQTLSSKLAFSGQVSAWSNYNFDNELPLQLGGRYIPTMEYDITLPNTHLLDFELAANIYGTVSAHRLFPVR